MNLEKTIRNIENHPKEGIVFRDITTLLQDKDSFKEAVDVMAEKIDPDVDKIVGIEARGFIFASALTYKLNKGFIPVRKPGKLPYEKISESYSLEYGKDAIEIHVDAINKGDKVAIVDDLLATGGTAKASVNLIEKLGGEIDVVLFLIELVDLNGRELLNGQNVKSIIKYW